MPLAQPLGGLRSFNMHVALGRTYLDLRDFCLRHMCFRLHFLLLLFLFVFEFSVICYFGDGRLRVGGYIDKVEAELLGFCGTLASPHLAEIAAVGADDAPLRRADALIHPNALFFSLRSVFGESHLTFIVGALYHERLFAVHRYSHTISSGPWILPNGRRSCNALERISLNCAKIVCVALRAPAGDPDGGLRLRSGDVKVCCAVPSGGR